MKKLSKSLAIAFFGLLTLTFFMLFISSLVSIGDVIDLFDYMELTWSSFVAWLLELALSVVVLVFSIKMLVQLIKEKEVKEKHDVKLACLLLGVYLAVLFVEQLIVIIHYSTIGSIDLGGTAIPLMVFEVIGAVAFGLMLKKWDKSMIEKIIAGVGFIFLFVTLIMLCSNASGFTVAFLVFMIIATLVGAAYVELYDVDFKKVFAPEHQAKPEEKEDKPLPEPKEEKATVEEKLAKIKDLHEKGLIDDEEYASKRKDIIDKL